MLRKLVPGRELFNLFSKLFRKRRDDALGKSREARATLRSEAAAVEKKIGNLLDRIVESDSSIIISRYESEVEKLEREKLVLAEKTAKCGTIARDYDESFRTALEFIGNETLGIFGEMVRLKISVSY